MKHLITFLTDDLEQFSGLKIKGKYVAVCIDREVDSREATAIGSELIHKLLKVKRPNRYEQNP